jgi:hypothetical protein
MKIPLNDFQRSYAQNRVGFAHDLLSKELAETEFRPVCRHSREGHL